MGDLDLDFRSGDYGGERWMRTSPRKELQGPRPAFLNINKDSHKIRKPPIPPAAAQHNKPAKEPPPVDGRQPVIIYAVSPKVIHTTVSDFMNLVQRLTGNIPPATSDRASTALSPAARLASIEKASPRFKEKETTITSVGNFQITDFVGNILESTDIEVGRIPGILSPAPGTLQPIPPGFFSPVIDPFENTMYIPSPNFLYASTLLSPSTLFSSPMAAYPSPSSCDPFNPFFDF